MALCRFMKWSWVDYLMTPTDVILAAYRLAERMAREQKQAADAARSRR